MSTQIQRFTFWSRLQHALVILLFGVLLVTGLPQKWPELDLSRWSVEMLGGILSTRWWHRIAGYAFVALLVAHLVTVLRPLLAGKGQPSMLISAQDFRDAILNLRYYLGREERPPAFGRFSYGQKFEYWGLIFGALIMAGSGLLLRFPIVSSRLLPAELIPVAKVVHSNEAMLAFSIVLVWHMYSAHLSPEVFPMDSSIFTGKISRERLEHEHPLDDSLRPR